MKRPVAKNRLFSGEPRVVYTTNMVAVSSMAQLSSRLAASHFPHAKRIIPSGRRLERQQLLSRKCAEASGKFRLRLDESRVRVDSTIPFSGSKGDEQTKIWEWCHRLLSPNSTQKPSAKKRLQPNTLGVPSCTPHHALETSTSSFMAVGTEPAAIVGTKLGHPNLATKIKMGVDQCSI